MQDDAAQDTRLLIPALGNLYRRLSPYSYSFMRFSAGAVLVPHGVQKVLYLHPGRPVFRQHRGARLSRPAVAGLPDILHGTGRSSLSRGWLGSSSMCSARTGDGDGRTHARRPAARQRTGAIPFRGCSTGGQPVAAPTVTGASMTLGCSDRAIVTGIRFGWAFCSRGTMTVRIPYSKLAVISSTLTCPGRCT